jgi:hypothetical protein
MTTLLTCETKHVGEYQDEAKTTSPGYEFSDSPNKRAANEPENIRSLPSLLLPEPRRMSDEASKETRLLSFLRDEPQR